MSNRTFNERGATGGVPGPEQGRSKVGRLGCSGGGFYTLPFARDGQARWTGVQ